MSQTYGIGKTQTAKLLSVIQEFFERKVDIKFVGLCTVDGFDVCHLSRTDVLPDKVAAIASSLFTLSDSAAENILHKSIQVSIVETLNGNILFIRTRLLGNDGLLAVAADDELSLAEVRYHSIQLKEKLESLHTD